MLCHCETGGETVGAWPEFLAPFTRTGTLTLVRQAPMLPAVARSAKGTRASEGAPRWRSPAAAGTSPMKTTLNASLPAAPVLHRAAGRGCQESHGPAGRPRAGGGVTFRPETAISGRRALMLTGIGDAGGRTPAAQQIFEALALAVVEGRLRPGDRLNTVELARRFGTSRTPVREALAGLERQGAVVVPARRRPWVAGATLSQIRDICDLSASLLTLVSELIVDTCRAADLAGLWAWQAALEADAARGAVEDYFWRSVGFRVAEVRLAGSEDLQRMVAALGIGHLRCVRLSLSPPGRLQRSAADHRRLLLACSGGDKAAAASITRTLIMSGYQAIERSHLAGAAPAPA
jgi:DNA-binding GntR family transcriptional regulator